MNININLDSIYEFYSDGITVIRDNKIIDLNESFYKFLRAEKKEDLIGKSIFDFIHPDLLEIVQGKLELLINEKTAFKQVNVKLFCFDGKVRRFEFSAIPILYNDAESILLISREVESYYQIIEELEEKKEKINCLLTSLADLIFVIDFRKFIIDYYPKDNSLFLTEPSNLLNKNIYDSLPEYLSKNLDLLVDKVLTNGIKEEIEYYLIINDKKYYFISSIVKKNEKEVLVTVRNVTPQKEAILALEEEIKFNSIISNLSMRFINCRIDEFDLILNQTLEDIGKYFDVDQINILEFDFTNKKIINHYQWHKEELEKGIDYSKALDSSLILFLEKVLKIKEILIIEDLKFLEENIIKNFLTKLKINSWLIHPIKIENDCIGFVSFDIVKSPRHFTEKEINFLKLLSNILSNVLLKVKTEKKLESQTFAIEQARIAALNTDTGLQKEILNKQLVEGELRISEQKFRKYVEHTNGIIFVLDRNGKFTYLSPAVKDILNYDIESLVGQQFVHLFDPKDKNFGRSVIKKLIQTSDVYKSSPIQIKSKDGRYIWIIYHLSPIYDINGKIKEIIGICIDVNELIETKQLLSLTDARYRSLFENQIEAFAFNEIILDESGNPLDFKFLDVNKSFLELTGLSKKDEIIGKTAFELWPKFDKDLIKIFGEVALSNGKKKIEKFLSNFNKTFLINVYSQEIMKFALSLIDIGEIKKAELIRTIQLNIANQLIQAKDIKEVLLSTRNQLHQLIDTTNFFVARYDEKNNQFKSLLFIDENIEKEKIWAAENSFSGLVLKNKTPLVFKKKEILEIIKGFNNQINFDPIPEIWVGIPILLKNKNIGVIAVQDYLNPNAYDQTTIDILQIIANEIAIFIEHQESEAQLKLLLKAIEQSPTMIFITDKNKNIQFANKKFFEITKYSPEEIIGKNPRILKSKYYDSNFYKQMWDNLSVGKEWHCEFLNINKFGKEYWVNAIISPVFDLDDRITNYIAFEEDITERKKLQKEIEGSQKQLRAVWNNSFDGFRLTDDNGIIVDVNQALCDIYDVTKEELIGKPYYVFIKDYSGSGLKVFKEKINSGNFEKLKEYNLLLTNGRNITVEVTNSVLILEDNKKYLFSIFRDITEKKKMINDLIAAKERAEEMNKIKTQFFAIMSHELRTPFMGIMGFTELLIDKITDEEGLNYLNGIKSSSNRMLETLTNILDISKFETGKNCIVKEFVDVGLIIKEICEKYRYLANQKNLNFQTNIELLVDFKKKTNPYMFRCILNNLLNNAIKFTNEGSVILNAFISEPNLVIEVIDTGIGISKDKINLIFEEFRQISEGYSRAYEGTGLGLSIVKKFLEILGGKLYVESKLNYGSKFSVLLPIED